VAAEEGMWLVLRNIEETPSDLLSFLLPLIQENELHVTSTTTIRPKLGFRLCFLQKVTEEIHHQDIKPLTDILYKVQVDCLQTRPDFKQILQHISP
jgi:midasin (ATPase involved in ribosome maturation)